MSDSAFQLNDTWIQHLCEAFQLGNYTHWTTTGGTRNTAVKLECNSGQWLARQRFAGYCDADRIGFDHAVAAYLAERACPVVVPRRTEHGDPCWRDGDRLWEVFPYVAGRPMKTADPHDLAALGTAVAQLHAAGREFPERFEKLGPRGETDPGDLLVKCTELSAISIDCTEAVAVYRPWIEQARAQLPDHRYARLPKTLIHGDIQPGNVFFNDTGVAAFVDLDWACYAPRIYDLGFALLFCCASHEREMDPANIWSLTQPLQVRDNLMEIFMRAYASAGEALTQEETEVLPAQMMLSWCHARIVGAYKVPEEDRAAFLARPPYSVTDILGGYEAQWGL